MQSGARQYCQGLADCFDAPPPLYACACRYEGADGEWNTRLCRSLPLDQDALLKGFPEKRILMIGDSHVRNVFTALVSGVREEEFFAEAHGYHAVFQYSVGARRDRWRLVDPESFPGLKLLTEQERVANAEIQFGEAKAPGGGAGGLGVVQGGARAASEGRVHRYPTQRSLVHHVLDRLIVCGYAQVEALQGGVVRYQ